MNPKLLLIEFPRVFNRVSLILYNFDRPLSIKHALGGVAAPHHSIPFTHSAAPPEEEERKRRIRSVRVTHSRRCVCYLAQETLHGVLTRVAGLFQRQSHRVFCSNWMALLPMNERSSRGRPPPSRALLLPPHSRTGLHGSSSSRVDFA